MKTPFKNTLSFFIVTLFIVKTAYPTDLNGDGVLNKADCQEFLSIVSAGTSSKLSQLDIDNDGVTNLKDVLLYGQWINGLWSNPSGKYTTLYSSNPQDTVAYNNYQKNLLTRKNTWTPKDLKSVYPDSTDTSNLNYNRTTVEYSTEVGALLDSAGYIDQVLKKGAAVYSGLEYNNFFLALDAIHNADLPLLFTTDALLQTIHRSYENILIQLEVNNFTTYLEYILSTSLAYLNKTYGNADHVDDVRTYFKTALKLLNPNRTDIIVNADIESFIKAISTQKMVTVTLFGQLKVIDFSQFSPRGHYTKKTELKNYFKTMMWLSRADIAFEIGGSHLKDRSRMKKGSLIVWDCVVNSGAYPQWLEFNRILEYMVGTSDGLAIKGMGYFVHDMGISDIPDFVANFDEKKFDSTATLGNYGVQTILSEFKTFQSLEDELELSRIFNFMPQRFIIDSYTMSQLVFPITTRIMPSSLDIAFVLGDNTALGDLGNMQPLIPGILGSQRQLYDEISKAGWESNMYTSWINFLRQLTGAEKNSKVSPVFRTNTWAKKMRNTQLTSWAHLRHNTILYAKQSYAGNIACTYPKAYVEPYPDFFHAVTAYALKGEKLFSNSDTQIAKFFSTVAKITTQLAEIATLTAQGREPSAAQTAWLRNTITSTSQLVFGGCAVKIKVYDGWYFDLLFDLDLNNEKESGTHTTISDIHTKPADETGPAQVLHAATGKINLITVVIELDTCTSLFVGPVGSYYDVTTADESSPKRLTDNDWKLELYYKQTGKPSKAKKPSWTEMYTY